MIDYLPSCPCVSVSFRAIHIIDYCTFSNTHPHTPIHTHLGEYEMMLLESTLEKITSLLRVGFGEAGAGIIRANLNMQGKNVYVRYCSVCVGGGIVCACVCVWRSMLCVYCSMCMRRQSGS